MCKLKEEGEVLQQETKNGKKKNWKKIPRFYIKHQYLDDDNLNIMIIFFLNTKN